MATTLQDELSAMNVAIPYLAIPELEKSQKNAAKEADDEEEPAWKKQADLEREKRQAQAKEQARHVVIRKSICVFLQRLMSLLT